MKRYYYLLEDIDSSSKFQQALIEDGIPKQHIQVYGLSDQITQKHGFNGILSVFKTDVVHYLMRGLLIGMVLSALVIGLLLFLQVPYAVTFALIGSVLVTGFITWEAGLIGLHKVNYKLNPLRHLIDNNHHIVLVDISDQQTSVLVKDVKHTKGLKPVAVGSSLINPFAEQESLLV